jgi:protein TonB
VSPAQQSAAALDLDREATAAEQALLAGDLAEAARRTQAAHAIDPESVRVRFLMAQVTREQARAAARRRATEVQAGAAAEIAAEPPLRGAAQPTSTSPAQAPAQIPAQIPAQALAQTPVVAASPTTSEPAIAVAVPRSGPPSSTPPASEAHDRNSVAAVILERVYSVDPEFPDIAREQDLSGFVDLEFTVHADGTVGDVNVLKAKPIGVFEKAAVEAVSKWRYKPIERDGVPVDEHARLRLNFAYK